MRPVAVQSQPCGRLRNASPGTARNDGLPTVAGKLPGLLAVCLEDGEDAKATASLLGRGCTLRAAAASHPARTPRRPAIVRQRRSCGP